MKKRPTIGRAEMEILRYITDHQPVTVREVADHVARTKGHGRTTVLSVMARLRKKRYLTRKSTKGIYHYSPSVPKTELMQHLVGDFIEKTLGGSLSPFVAYLSHHGDLSDSELKELRKLVKDLENQPAKEWARHQR